MERILRLDLKLIKTEALTLLKVRMIHSHLIVGRQGKALLRLAWKTVRCILISNLWNKMISVLKLSLQDEFCKLSEGRFLNKTEANWKKTSSSKVLTATKFHHLQLNKTKLLSVSRSTLWLRRAAQDQLILAISLQIARLHKWVLFRSNSIKVPSSLDTVQWLMEAVPTHLLWVVVKVNHTAPKVMFSVKMKLPMLHAVPKRIHCNHCAP